MFSRPVITNQEVWIHSSGVNQRLNTVSLAGSIACVFAENCLGISIRLRPFVACLRHGAAVDLKCFVVPGNSGKAQPRSCRSTAGRCMSHVREAGAITRYPHLKSRHRRFFGRRRCVAPLPGSACGPGGGARLASTAPLVLTESARSGLPPRSVLPTPGCSRSP